MILQKVSDPQLISQILERFNTNDLKKELEKAPIKYFFTWGWYYDGNYYHKSFVKLDKDKSAYAAVHELKTTRMRGIHQTWIDELKGDDIKLNICRWKSHFPKSKILAVKFYVFVSGKVLKDAKEDVDNWWRNADEILGHENLNLL